MLPRRHPRLNIYRCSVPSAFDRAGKAAAPCPNRISTHTQSTRGNLPAAYSTELKTSQVLFRLFPRKPISGREPAFQLQPHDTGGFSMADHRAQYPCGHSRFEFQGNIVVTTVSSEATFKGIRFIQDGGCSNRGRAQMTRSTANGSSPQRRRRACSSVRSASKPGSRNLKR